MKCPACGRENRAGAGYCAWCGQLLRERSQPMVPGGLTVQETGQDLVTDETILPDDTDDEAELALSPFAQETRGKVTQEPIAPVVEAEAAPQSGSAAEEEQLPGEDRPPIEACEGELAPERALQPSDLLAGRYRILEQTVSLPERNAYRAQDLAYCGACGFDQNEPTDAYCQECGAALATPALVTIVENLRHVPERYDLYFSQGEREYFVTLQEPAPEPEEAHEAPLRLHWGYLTDPGLVRDHNEDAIDVRVYTRIDGFQLGLFAVADGLGGQDSGEVASRMALDAVWEALRAQVWEPCLRNERPGDQAMGQAVREAFLAANQTVYDARIERKSEMSTTLTLALVVNERVHIGNVGDSRIYCWSSEGLEPITKDHSLVQRLVDAGQIQPEEVYTHAERHVIYQSIGDRPDVEVDLYQHQLAPDERLILCSDGLWEMVRSEGLEDVLLAEPDPQRACERLVRNANLAGGEDNISVIMVQAQV
jgi:serine/threonine protein phosphatase PrpC